MVGSDEDDGASICGDVGEAATCDGDMVLGLEPSSRLCSSSLLCPLSRLCPSSHLCPSSLYTMNVLSILPPTIS